MTTFGKKRKLAEMQEAERVLDQEKRYFVQLVNGDDQSTVTGPICEIDAQFSKAQLNELLNQLLLHSGEKDAFGVDVPFSFYLDGKSEITGTVRDTLLQNTDDLLQRKSISSQDAPLRIIYYPQALFKIRPVTRCSATLPGHSEAVLGIQFSPDGSSLASASGDATVRIWDINTETPEHTLKGHQNWVLSVAWSPDGKKLASGGKDNIVRVWWAAKGESCGNPLRGHKKWITALSWEPYHLCVYIDCSALCSIFERDCDESDVTDHPPPLFPSQQKSQMPKIGKLQQGRDHHCLGCGSLAHRIHPMRPHQGRHIFEMGWRRKHLLLCAGLHHSRMVRRGQNPDKGAHGPCTLGKHNGNEHRLCSEKRHVRL